MKEEIIKSCAELKELGVKIRIMISYDSKTDSSWQYTVMKNTLIIENFKDELEIKDYLESLLQSLNRRRFFVIENENGLLIYDKEKDEEIVFKDLYRECDLKETCDLLNRFNDEGESNQTKLNEK
jgi:hypothetical protein